MNQIFINTKQNEETRVIVVENNKLIGYEQERPGQENKKGDIYKGVVTRIQESLGAAFVDFGEEKNGFLPLKEIPENMPGVSPEGLKVGDSLLVQIKKDHVGDKGAGLTSQISLAGCYLVIQPNRRNRALISKHGDHDARTQMQRVINSLNVPEGISVILRTAGLGRSEEELRWDLESYLLKLWGAIDSAGRQIDKPMLVYHENNLLLRIVRDYFRPEKSEIVCDNLEVYEELRELMTLMFPEHLGNLRYHDSDEEMVSLSLENQIDEIFEREVTTSSGVRVVFDSTEALVAIDVNSGSARGGADIEETALATNLEAADVIALHLRLRNLGGLIVVDFIDMEKEKNRQQLEKHLFQALKKDRARIRCANISQFGLVEISRQRVSRALAASLQSPCARCGGTGIAWQTEAFALRLLRRIRAVAISDNVGALLVQAPAAAAIYLLNEKRIEIRKIEDSCDCDILIAPNEDMHPPQYNIKPVKGGSRIEDSYRIVQKRADKKLMEMREQLETRLPAPKQQPLLRMVLPEKKAPVADKSNGFIKRLFSSLFTEGNKQAPARAGKSAAPPTKRMRDKKARPSRGGGGGGGQANGNETRRPRDQRRPSANGDKSAQQRAAAKSKHSAKTTTTNKASTAKSQSISDPHAVTTGKDSTTSNDAAKNAPIAAKTIANQQSATKAMTNNSESSAMAPSTSSGALTAKKNVDKPLISEWIEPGENKPISAPPAVKKDESLAGDKKPNVQKAKDTVVLPTIPATDAASKSANDRG